AHRMAGDWLERRGEPQPLVLAEHFELGREDPRAMEAYARAAAQALRHNDLLTVLARADKAISLGAAGGALPTVQGARAPAVVGGMRRDDAMSAYEAALAASTDTRRCAEICAELAAGDIMRVDGVPRRYAERAVALAEQTRRPDLEALALASLGVVTGAEGD